MADEESAEGMPRAKKPRGKGHPLDDKWNTDPKWAVPTTPLVPAPPVSAEAEELLNDKDKLLARLKKDLMENYILEVRAGQDTMVNPQNSRASRKQAKEIAELLITLTAKE